MLLWVGFLVLLLVYLVFCIWVFSGTLFVLFCWLVSFLIVILMLFCLLLLIFILMSSFQALESSAFIA